jgi:hypothetical protein
LKELFASCETDCAEGCRYGCIGWLHRFDAVTFDQEAGVAGDLPAYRTKPTAIASTAAMEDQGTGTGAGDGADGERRPAAT